MPVRRLALLVLLPALAPLATAAQGSPAAEAYEKRLRQESIGGRYVPRDLNDAMETLERLTSAESREAYASRGEDEVVEKLWFSFGRWIATNWGFYDGSRFSAYLRRLGVDTPDGQKEFVMRAYHRHLNGRDLDVRQLAEDYKARKAAADSLRLLGATVIERLPTPPADTTGPR